MLQRALDAFYFLVLAIGVVSTVSRYLQSSEKKRWSVLIFDSFSVLFTLAIIYIYVFIGEAFQTDSGLENPIWVIMAIVLSFIREASIVRFYYKRSSLNPGQLFILSFLLIILVGSFLLMLPNATYEGLSFTDALFTSTSAVCVTGLIVVDTGSYFTGFGQLVILMLIQAGGLGILTFVSYFSYFFKGFSSYEGQLAMNEITPSKGLRDVFTTLKYIILITFSVEAIAAFGIYMLLDEPGLGGQQAQIFFSIFHAVSAFCNAGFSTLPNSLYEEGWRFNYFLHLIVILTFVIGGLGFPIVSNIITYLKYSLRKITFFSKEEAIRRPWVLKLDSRINLITTLSISAVAFVAFYFLEYNNTLADHSGFGKVITALFGATTPRTAGFNTIDTGAMLLPTTLMVFVLMWIGASPSSTGGGIKTSTIAIAVLNVISVTKGKDNIEVFRRTITHSSVKRAFSIISLSLLVIVSGIILISAFDSEKELLDISFECFSAYSTVGLSLGITADLSTPSKYVIIFIMFVGRVNMLTIIMALFKRRRQPHYRYPSEKITIN